MSPLYYCQSFTVSLIRQSNSLDTVVVMGSAEIALLTQSTLIRMLLQGNPTINLK